MTQQSHVPPPGHPDQARKRTVFRVLGVVFLGGGLTMLGIGLADFFGSFDDPLGVDDGPGLFWLNFVALPVLFVGLVCLQAGFVGAAARYGAGETAPVVKDTAAYLTDGQGVLGVGRTVDDSHGSATGPFCRSCGTRNDADARFCDSCGNSMA